ncbi:GLPGLI family protein [Chryseobacterium sp. FH1]|uniref:GLPGLI family protein n=1 Tax=Chryseobacterium sp. FH1 TaxID=1233951 RepID=UPI0004E3294C|nr:GLPGLI family protein [Chryseobacterium sp. FH1]KFC19963.1 hypothetical protein IO90_12140 [Chryseobacterium sp. FH1]
MKMISLLFVFVSAFTFSQTHRFIYELKYKTNPEETDPKKAFMVLDINPNDVKYYSYTFLEKDSINKATNSQNRSWNDELLPVTRKRNSTKNTNFVMVADNLYSYPTNDIIKWNLTNETKKYQGFNIQKATSEFGGRNWMAWFTKDIPFAEGPYKFQGLPGLVILLEDSEQHYVFDLVRSNNLKTTYDTSNILEFRYGDKPIPTTESKVVKKALEYFNDPLSDIREGLNDGKIKEFTYYGTSYKAEELGKLIKEEQNEILENYNPIELDKAFAYPKK